MTSSLDSTKNGSRSSPYLWLFTLFLLLIAIIWWGLWFFHWRYYESTDDAYASGHLIVINAAIPGSVTAYYAENTELVIEGQPLIELDRTAYQIKYEKALANLAETVLQVRQLYDTVLSQQTVYQNKLESLKRLKYDYENRAHLVETKAISNEEFIHAKNSYIIAQLELKQAEYQLQLAIDARGHTPIKSHPRIEQAKADVRQAYYDLYHCTVYAPATGIVAQKTVDVGKSVTATTALMSIIPQKYLWVDANFKETQLGNMRIGQPASVYFDIYGSKRALRGVVSGISAGSGSVFSLIPPQNATGNWIKIVQRLPVRIDLDPQDLKGVPTQLGLSADVTVDITNQELPPLATIAPEKPVATTSVFQFSYDDVNDLIDYIIDINLHADI
jgi:membrane fusion protein (multidrug efflux system)